MIRIHLRQLGVVAATVVLALGFLVLGTPVHAHAANNVPITDWTAEYTVRPNGDLAVVETLTYDFTGFYSKHGMERSLVVREPYTPDDSKDRVYEIKDLHVTSTARVSTKVQTRTVDSKGGQAGRNKVMIVRVGDENRTVSGVVAYTLSYTIEGALRSDSNGDDLYWDVFGSEMPQVKQVTVTVNVPGDIRKAECKFGTTSTVQTCPQSQNGHTVRFTASHLGEGKMMTFGVVYPENSTPNNQPKLVENASKQAALQWLIAGVASALTGIASLIGGLLWWRKNSRDDRYLGVAPGLMPAPGEPENIGRDNRPEIPVQFTPPPLTPGEAGLLADGLVDVRDTTATLVDLAVRGALKLTADERSNRFATVLIDPSLARHPHEQALLDVLFEDVPPGVEVDLADQGGPLYIGHKRVSSAIRATAQQAGWYRKKPWSLGGVGGRIKAVGSLGLVGAIFLGGGVHGPLLLFVIPLVPIFVVIAILALLSSKGRRSGLGRALTDQVEGFRTYIATAEAEQLKFEEGEDIYSRYLPWAIAFNVAERWTKVCQRLVELGRIPDVQPSWYYGTWYGYGYFNADYLNDAASIGSLPVSASSGAGSGEGSFGGVSLGGGGGGGGAGSW